MANWIRLSNGELVNLDNISHIGRNYESLTNRCLDYGVKMEKGN